MNIWFFFEKIWLKINKSEHEALIALFSTCPWVEHRWLEALLQLCGRHGSDVDDVLDCLGSWHMFCYSPSGFLLLP